MPYLSTSSTKRPVGRDVCHQTRTQALYSLHSLCSGSEWTLHYYITLTNSASQFQQFESLFFWAAHFLESMITSLNFSTISDCSCWAAAVDVFKFQLCSSPRKTPSRTKPGLCSDYPQAFIPVVPYEDRRLFSVTNPTFCSVLSVVCICHYVRVLLF